MILLSPDAVEDVERLRTFLDQTNPGAARRALALIWTAIERLQELVSEGLLGGLTEKFSVYRLQHGSGKIRAHRCPRYRRGRGDGGAIRRRLIGPA